MCRSAKSRAASVRWDSSSALRYVTAVWSSAAVGSSAAVWSSSVTWASGSRPAGTGTDGWPPRSVIRRPEGMRPESFAGPPCAPVGTPGRAGLHRRWVVRRRPTAFQSCLTVAVRVPERFPGRVLLLRRLAVEREDSPAAVRAACSVGLRRQRTWWAHALAAASSARLQRAHPLLDVHHSRLLREHLFHEDAVHLGIAVGARIGEHGEREVEVRRLPERREHDAARGDPGEDQASRAGRTEHRVEGAAGEGAHPDLGDDRLVAARGDRGVDLGAPWVRREAGGALRHATEHEVRRRDLREAGSERDAHEDDRHPRRPRGTDGATGCLEDLGRAEPVDDVVLEVQDEQGGVGQRFIPCWAMDGSGSHLRTTNLVHCRVPLSCTSLPAGLRRQSPTITVAVIAAPCARACAMTAVTSASEPSTSTG